MLYLLTQRLCFPLPDFCPEKTRAQPRCPRLLIPPQHLLLPGLGMGEQMGPSWGAEGLQRWIRGVRSRILLLPSVSAWFPVAKFRQRGPRSRCHSGCARTASAQLRKEHQGIAGTSPEAFAPGPLSIALARAGLWVGVRARPRALRLRLRTREAAQSAFQWGYLKPEPGGKRRNPFPKWEGGVLFLYIIGYAA